MNLGRVHFCVFGHFGFLMRVVNFLLVLSITYFDKNLIETYRICSKIRHLLFLLLYMILKSQVFFSKALLSSFGFPRVCSKYVA